MPYASMNSLAAMPDEELAGPPVPFTPTSMKERLSSVDVLRGFALLGILVMNIEDFGTTEGTQDIPIGTPIDSFSGSHAHLNLLVLLFKWLFFEGKMRGIFSMLFGAGVVLLTSRAEKRGAGAAVADIFTRRYLLLMLFGFLHGCFIWNGDILFDYSLPALLFLYPARKLPAKVMIFSGLFLSLTVATFGLLLYTRAGIEIPLSRQAAAVTLRQQHQQPLSPADVAVEKEWQATVAHHRITPETVKKQLTEARSGYWQHVSENLQQYYGPGVFHHANFLLIIENLSVMLIGMGLIKTGFLRGESSNRTYFYTILAGFAVSLPLYLYGILHCYASGFYFLALDKWLWLPYNLTRDAGMLAIAAVVMLMVKNGILRTPQRWLAAVGKTAFSNYIGTSILCQFIFLWGPWKLFGKPEYYQLMYVVFAVWAVNIVFSTLWLQRFEYGPLEWLWRSLTYGKAQPMRLRELPAAA